ncbi:hypothetical protein CISIN_1g008457mg [Citrus sinensis]|uniref:Methyltransferase type 12 domain-containing protein n=1 Tax=Citrus sinensis TaxID=2711 RepID=A0A067GDD3_CITSI|nr:hypothetical protein CISIN_1g008457mg [Citrus sinensis]
MESSNAPNAGIGKEEAPKLQIYPTPNTGVSPFWRDKYEREAKKYWDLFYKRHQDRFFKDRHYLDKEWGRYFSGAGRKDVLEVGCGAGNTIFPLIAAYPDVFVYACDFSPRAVNLVMTHKDFTETRVSTFVCDLISDDLSRQISPSSIDIVTMERLTGKDQKISENFYVRGDGTRAFYFSNDFLTSLFKENGFDVEELGLCCKQVENRARELVMNRRWVQAVFCSSGGATSSSEEASVRVDIFNQAIIEPDVAANTLKEPMNDSEVDMSEGVAFEMFGLSSFEDNEMIEVNLRDRSFKIEVLSKEYQHTCRSTGLMLWESAHLMAAVLARNPTIVAGKKVLELGCGCGGICSMVAAGSADLVVATDGDSIALDLLAQNVTANLKPPFLAKLITKRLEWGNRDHIEAIKEENNEGFEVILGTDVSYIPEAILPLFATAKELTASSNKSLREDQQPAFILCHIFRQVDEPSMLSAATQCGFRLVDKWPSKNSASPSESIISSWFSENGHEVYLPSPALNIMYFQVE